MFKLNDKRGIGIVFNWIFSLIAGVIILSFLVYFAVQNTDLFGKVTARVVAEELDVLFSGYETTETSSNLNFGREVELSFECDESNLVQKFGVNGEQGKKTWGKVIFAPEEIKSENINIATRSWDVPFRVGNFIYIWDKKYDIQGISDNIFFDKLKGEGEVVNFIPFTTESGCSGTGKNIYYKKVGDDYYGYVCFDSRKVNFYGEAMLLGTVFVEDPDEFECLNHIIEKKFQVISDVYERKIGTLIASRQCGTDYGGFGGGLTQFKNNYGDASQMRQAISAMEAENTRLVREGCASVY